MPAKPTTPVDRAPFWTTKDFARKMQLSTKRVKHWWKFLQVPPDACAGNGLHRWTEAGATRLLTAWRDYWASRGRDPEIVKLKAGGGYKETSQIIFNFNAKLTPEIRILPGTVGKAVTRAKERGDEAKIKTRASQGR